MDPLVHRFLQRSGFAVEFCKRFHMQQGLTWGVGFPRPKKSVPAAKSTSKTDCSEGFSTSSFLWMTSLIHMFLQENDRVQVSIDWKKTCSCVATPETSVLLPMLCKPPPINFRSCTSATGQKGFGGTGCGWVRGNVAVCFWESKTIEAVIPFFPLFSRMALLFGSHSNEITGRRYHADSPLKSYPRGRWNATFRFPHKVLWNTCFDAARPDLGPSKIDARPEMDSFQYPCLIILLGLSRFKQPCLKIFCQMGQKGKARR